MKALDPKRCRTCGEMKPRAEFYPSGKSVHPSCRPCSRINALARRRENPEIQRAHSRKSRDKNREKNRKKWREWARANRGTPKQLAVRKEWRKRTGWRPTRPSPIVANARNKVCRAVKRGLLVKPANCSQCGSMNRIEGHHEDYSKPLEVVWLCKKCHAALQRIDVGWGAA